MFLIGAFFLSLSLTQCWYLIYVLFLQCTFFKCFRCTVVFCIILDLMSKHGSKDLVVITILVAVASANILLTVPIPCSITCIDKQLHVSPVHLILARQRFLKSKTLSFGQFLQSFNPVCSLIFTGSYLSCPFGRYLVHGTPGRTSSKSADWTVIMAHGLPAFFFSFFG